MHRNTACLVQMAIAASTQYLDIVGHESFFAAVSKAPVANSTHTIAGNSSITSLANKREVGPARKSSVTPIAIGSERCVLHRRIGSHAPHIATHSATAARAGVTPTPAAAKKRLSKAGN